MPLVNEAHGRGPTLVEAWLLPELDKSASCTFAAAARDIFFPSHTLAFYSSGHGSKVVEPRFLFSGTKLLYIRTRYFLGCHKIGILGLSTAIVILG